VDVLGDALAETYGKAMDILVHDPAVDGIIAILTPQVVTQIKETADEVGRLFSENKKPVVACFMGGKRMDESREPLARMSIPNYPFPERAVSALQGLAKYQNWLSKPEGTRVAVNVDKAAAAAVFARIEKDGKTTIGDVEGREILSAYGIRTIQSFLARDIEGCRECVRKTGFPVVLKLVSPDILHKTEAGGVKVGIGSVEDAEKAFNDIIASARQYKKDARITGVQIQQQIEKAQEVIIGVSKDPQFGQMLMFGLGGIFVEVLKDVSFRIIPVTDADVAEMVREIKGYKVLQGFRSIPPSDIASVKDVLQRISRLCTDFPQIEEMDINPLMVFEEGKGVVAVDVRFAVEKGECTL